MLHPPTINSTGRLNSAAFCDEKSGWRRIAGTVELTAVLLHNAASKARGSLLVWLDKDAGTAVPVPARPLPEVQRGSNSVLRDHQRPVQSAAAAGDGHGTKPARVRWSGREVPALSLFVQQSPSNPYSCQTLKNISIPDDFGYSSDPAQLIRQAYRAAWSIDMPADFMRE